MNEIEERAIGVAEAEDEALNAVLGSETGIPLAGNCHATCSQRWGQYLLYGTPWQKFRARIYDAVLTWIENHVFGIPTKSHCLSSLTGFPTDLPKTG